MAEKDWAAILKSEDRIIANSDRRFRYHCYSLESMSEELTYKERSIYMQDCNKSAVMRSVHSALKKIRKKVAA